MHDNQSTALINYHFAKFNVCQSYLLYGTARGNNNMCQSMLLVNLSYLQSIYISFLLRKDKLVKYFRELQIFKDDIQYPAEVCIDQHTVMISIGQMIYYRNVALSSIDPASYHVNCA